MTMNVDDEILQDFLVEASEILESLSEQLIDLEQRPTDKELLNSVFRGFHTIKGGAGFLNITSLVEVCHRAEDVFNTLRQGHRVIDAELMDAVLSVVDIVNSIMAQVRAGEATSSAGQDLLKKLERYASPELDNQERPSESRVEQSQTEQDEIEREFDALLLESSQPGKDKPEPDPANAAPVVADRSDHSTKSSDEITEEEFEALLDQLQGGNKSEPMSSAARNQKEQSVPQASIEPVTKHADVSAAMVPVMDKEIRHELKLAPQPIKSIKLTGKNDPKETAKESAQTQLDTTVRVDTRRLDDIMNLVGELVLVRNRLATLKAGMENDEVSQAVGNLDVVTSDLQTAVMKTRMQPIKKVFGRFPRVVRDLSRTLKKEINLILIGEDTDLDKNLVEALSDPLVHLVRNSIDHGIEQPEVREKAGKSRVGTITLSARQEGDHILLSIQDDGAGMNADVLRRKAVEKGLYDEEAASRLEEKECYNLIFLPGFSTKAEISDISGRGVGMDVVKTRITQLNGLLDIDSEVGKGTSISIKLPLTLAILPTLMVMLRNQIFAIPLANVHEIIQLNVVKTNVVEGTPVAVIRDHPLPLYYLENWLLRSPTKEKASSEQYIVVIKYGTSQIACVVDRLMTQEEVVIKPLGALLHGLPGLAGATITGDGRIALILDMPGLISTYAKKGK